MAKQAFSKGNYAQAIKKCDQLLARMGKRDDLLNLKALSLLALGQLEEAETAILQALKLNPRVAGIHLNAGQIYQRLSRNKLVKRHAREAIQLATRDPVILYQAAVLYRDCGDQDQALRVIDRCLEIQPHQQQRAVTTASNLQVRQPVYTSSINKWKNYQPQLQTVVDMLNDHSIRAN